MSATILLKALCRVTAIVVSTAAALLAQLEPDPTLAQLRSAFEGVAAKAPMLAIASVAADEPIVLFARGADGLAVDSASPWPVGPLVRLLIADALSVSRDQRAVAATVEIGGRTCTVDDLIAGVQQLPECFVYDGSIPIDRDELLRCAAVYASIGETPSFSGGGAGELLLLEPLLLTGADRDWATFLRGRLAPHVSGFAPISADAVGPDDHPTVVAAAMGVRQAEPRALRLLLSAKDVAAWWQWRVRAGKFPKGWRIGGELTSTTRPGVEWWVAEHTKGPASFTAHVLPAQRAGLLVLGCDRVAATALCAAFDSDIVGPEEEAPRFGGRVGLKKQPPLAAVVGNWQSLPDTPACTLVVTSGAANALRIDVGGRTFGSLWARAGRDHVVVGTGDKNDPSTLLLVPDKARPAARLTVVFQDKIGGMRSLPRHFDLQRSD
jgi:hypothetical protein